ncbi:MAG: flavodoxin family protein [Clostridiales Family XIII bacterium]|jgi:multimeric flavodoxin WrbA|nr:flavodoxin family protein [Clostridiales Family XIII bacterium]
MKIIAFNGSPHKDGNTYQALSAVLAEVAKSGIETEIVQVGSATIAGCLGCGGCMNNKNEKCVIATDQVNEWFQLAKEADGFIIGSPVYFAGVAGTMKCFLDRFFYINFANNNLFRHKIGASVVALRRSGGTVTWDELNRFFMSSEMILPTSNYWNIVHGLTSGEIEQDKEGIQVLKILGENIAFATKAIHAAKGTEAPQQEKEFTNFI